MPPNAYESVTSCYDFESTGLLPTSWPSVSWSSVEKMVVPVADVVADNQNTRAAVEIENDGIENVCNRVVSPPHRLLHEDVVGGRSDHVSHLIIRRTAITRQRAIAILSRG